jgi:RNA polymerase sigma factor (sigma-70 family)
MNAAHCNDVVQKVRRLVIGGEAAPPDGELLQAFVDRRDERAFAGLVERHGAMVFAICQGVLRNCHDAEDAFQATFLVLAHKARSIRRHASLGSWLHGVALRVARKALTAAARPQKTAANATPSQAEARAPGDELSWREVHAVLHEALSELPEYYREPLVLCYFEGLTQDETAARLGWTPAQVKGRVQRGRNLLRGRLERRGLGLAAALGTTVLADQALAAPVPAALAAATVETAVSSAGAAARPAAVALAREIVGSAGPARIGTAAALFVLFVPLTGGVMLLSRFPADQPLVQAPVAARQATVEPRTDRFGDPLPDGAVSRLGTVRFNHGNRVIAFHITPDARTIISVGTGSICLWDATTGKEQARIATDSFRFGAPSQLLPDGRTLMILDQQDDSVQIWDLEQRKQIGKVVLPVKHTWWRASQKHALSPDGRLCSTHTDNHVQVWDTGTGKEVFRLPHEGGTIQAATFAGREMLVSADKKQMIEIWEVRTGKRVRQFVHGGPAEVLAASPDGRLLATLEHHTHAIDRLLDKDVVHVWDLATGTRKHTLAARPRSWFLGVQFSPDGAFVLAHRYGDNEAGITFWETESGRQVRELPTGGTVAMTPDGRHLVGGEGKFSAWDLKTGKQVPEEDNGRAFAAKIHLSASGDRVLTLGYSSFSTWDVATGKALRTVEMPPYFSMPPYRCCSPDGKYAVSFRGELLKKVDLLLWDVAAGKLLHTLSPSDALQWLSHTAFSQDSSLFAAYVSGKPNQVRIWEVGTGKEVRAIKETKAGWASGLAFSRDGRTLFVTGPRVVAYDVATGAERFSWRVQPPPSSVKSQEVGGRTPDDNDRASWRSLAFAPDGTVAAGVLWAEVAPHERVQDRLALCDARTGKVLRRWSDSGKNGNELEQVAFSEDGRLLATSDGAAIHVWEVATGGKVHTFRGHRNEILSLSFSAGRRRLASASRDSTILVWDLALALAPQKPTQPPDALAAWWDDLAGADASRAYASICRLAETPAVSIPFLRKRLTPVPAAAVDEMRQCIADLASDDFARRDGAFKRLRAHGANVAPLLREALEKAQSLESRRRMEQLLDSPESRPAAGELRALRALTVLEQAGTSEARRVLQDLASGGPGVWLTREAEAARKRVEARQIK